MLGRGMYGRRKEGVGAMDEREEADATSDAADVTRRG